MKNNFTFSTKGCSFSLPLLLHLGAKKKKRFDTMHPTVFEVIDFCPSAALLSLPKMCLEEDIFAFGFAVLFSFFSHPIV